VKGTRAAIDEFLSEGPWAVAGASSDRSKYGNKVLRAYLQNDMTVYPVNPRATEVEGLTAYASLADLPERVRGLSIVTPPEVTDELVDDAIELGIEHLWMQPGAESPAAIERARAAGLSVLAWGPCLLVALHYRE
jgi:predicted CoA-binding protein